MGLESPQHECAVIGIFSVDKPVSQDIYYGLLAMQNRGQESSGMTVYNPSGIPHRHKNLGLVNAVYDQSDIDGLYGYIGVGHNRYGTTGNPTIANAQPLAGESALGEFDLAHNGNLINAHELRQDLEVKGERFSSTSDSEVIAKLIATLPGNTYVEKIKKAASYLQGAYSCVVATRDSLIGFRDPYGVWQLNLGKLNGNGYVMASETNAIEKVGGEFVRNIENGEIVVVDKEGVSSDSLGRKPESLCSFEYFYFSDPFSKIMDRRVEGARFDMGRFLYREHKFEGDLVLPVPETARPAAEGYAYESKIPLRGALIRNRWLGRTFIQPSQRIRELEALLKYGVLSEIVDDKEIVVIDDSIVRGTTTRRIVHILRQAGAKKINVLSTAPPIIGACCLGVDTANKNELIATTKTISEIRDFIKTDQLGYLSLESGLQAIGDNLRDRLCVSCFTGKYQMKIPEKHDKFILEHV